MSATTAGVLTITVGAALLGSGLAVWFGWWRGWTRFLGVLGSSLVLGVFYGAGLVAIGLGILTGFAFPTAVGIAVFMGAQLTYFVRPQLLRPPWLKEAHRG